MGNHAGNPRNHKNASLASIGKSKIDLPCKFLQVIKINARFGLWVHGSKGRQPVKNLLGSRLVARIKNFVIFAHKQVGSFSRNGSVHFFEITCIFYPAGIPYDLGQQLLISLFSSPAQSLQRLGGSKVVAFNSKIRLPARHIRPDADKGKKCQKQRQKYNRQKGYIQSCFKLHVNVPS